MFDWPPDSLVEVELRVPSQPLVDFSLLGRTGRRHDDVDLGLTRIYGDGRTPQRRWNDLEDDLSIVERRPWRDPDPTWEI
ncbi:MAG TPA: hypothetical protein PLS29_00760 [Acidimicrobiales bacterium]|nr:MAG: hypothetical protein B7Z69_00325 [Actinobacteria bacterium 21-73-9]HQU25539.1 hypothetical protein [Acidimicrobiales bacterium]